MAEETKPKPCTFFLVRYVPDIARDEGLNIGLFLYSQQEEYLDCLFTDDFRRVRDFHPQADLELLKALPEHFEQQIKEREKELDVFIREMQESYSNLIQVTPPRGCLAVDPQAELENLYSRYVGTRVAPAIEQDSRMRIKQRLNDALARAGVLDRLERRVPAYRWTHEGDPFSFDFGYMPLLVDGKPNGHIKFVHALSLKRDNDLAATLKDRILKVRAKEPAGLTAVVGGLPAAEDEIANSTRTILEEAKIVIQPLAGVKVFAESIRRELMI
ncbi:MAG: DUF3037 domain-containing protein [Terriglobia bacterium]